MTTSRHPRFRRWTFPLAASLSLGAASGCIESKTGPGPDPAPEASLDWTRPAALTVAGSCEEAETWLENAAITQMDMQLEANRRCFLDTNDCGWYRGGVAEDAAGAPNAPSTDAGAQDDETPDEYSETNTQVEGVDEADRVKTDGTHLYTLSNQSLVVVKSWPAAETDEIGRVALRGYPQSFFLDGDRAIVLGQANLYDVSPDAPRNEPNRDGEDKPTETEPAPIPDEGGGSEGSSDGSDGAEAPSSDARPEGDAITEPGWYGYRQVSTVTIVDLSDKANPRIVKEYFFDGYAMDTRRIDDKVYLAQNSWVSFDGLQYWPNLNWGDETERPAAEAINAAFDELRANNVAAIRARTLDDWLPKVWTAEDGGDVAYASGRAVTGCTDVHVPSVFSGQSMLTLVTLDTDDDTVAGSTIQGQWGSVYASQEALYIGTTNWDFFWWWQGADEVPPIMTHVHKFGYDADGNARYSASGEVLGYAINQFAFDEFDGHLRVATTDGFGWWNNEETESRVTVLRQNGTHLDTTGVVAGLGLGERIFAVRFIGDQGYVVTFRQVDPLYVIDLADPANPTVAGELKIPGFSSYIHPLEDGFLLTAGRDGDDEGNIGGVKVEIFDVRDPANPTSVTTSVIGDGWNTWSDVLWDHKAFTFFRARNLLAIPVSGWLESEENGGWYGEYKSELALFRITTESIEPLPSVSHMGFFDDFGGNDRCRGYGGYWQANIFRGVFVEDYVYSLSQLGVQVHDTRDLAAGPVAEVALLAPEEFPYYDWGWCEGEIVDGGGAEPPREGDPADGGEEPTPTPDADGDTPDMP